MLSPVVHRAMLDWSFEPVTIAGLTLASALYARGLHRLWREAGRGRVVARWQAWSFWLGIVSLVIALLSPLDTMGDALFAAHMTQHLVLILISAPLIVFGAPVLPMLWAFDRRTRQSIGRWWNHSATVPALAGALTVPVVAWSLHVAAMWVWHLPGPYEAALASEWVHALEHVSFFGTAMLFWWVALVPSGRRHLGYGMAIAYVLVAGMLFGILGAILTFANHVWYPAQSSGAHLWGLTPLEDQQLAGIIMWVPSSFVYLAAASYLFVAWIRAEQPEPVTGGEGWTGY
ncbi:MAG TPA: cytochrome c oxidase assembly protein [Gemmatimonadaceae bacterium]|nr:cytochrome c oxidase assembly protein [Gemmatimonadaceae bacterium]